MNAMPPPPWLRGDALSAAMAPGSARVTVPDTVSPPSVLREALGAYLSVLGWEGGAAQLAGAVPHLYGALDPVALRVALANLGYATEIVPSGESVLGPEHLPVIVLDGDDSVRVIFRDEGGQPFAIALPGGQVAPLSSLAVGAPVIRLASAPEAPQGTRDSWLRGVLLGFSPTLRPLLVISLMLAVLGLALPIFIMAVFDVLIGGRSAAPLPLLLLGLGGALAFEAAFRALRMHSLARIGGRIDAIVSNAVLDRLLGLPLAMTERAGIGAQVNRVRDFGTVREFFSGSLALAALDAPFAVLLIGLLAAIGGPVALSPVFAVCLFGLLFLCVRGPMRRAVSAAAVSAQARDQLALEALGSMRLIRACGAVAVWRARHAAAAAQAAACGARVGMLGGLVMALGQAIVSLSALVAVGFGVHAVLQGTLSAGALIASMMVIWRVLGPLQMVFTILSRWEQVRASMRQTDQMMALPPEREPRAVARPCGALRGDISITRLSLRYLPQAEPALLSVSLDIRAGQVAALIGPSGAGKSSLLLSVLGLYRPSAGSVRIDGLDIRRFDPVELRRAIAYSPAVPQLLYGTVAQNLLLAQPGASEREIREAAAITGLDKLVAALPNGFDTRLGDNGVASIAASLLTRVSLTRIMLRRSAVVLMDEPASGLDDEGSAAVQQVIERLRGTATVLLVTHRPSHMAMADRVFRVTEGQVEEVRRTTTPVSVPLLSQKR